jgi:hypothetical protein
MSVSTRRESADVDVGSSVSGMRAPKPGNVCSRRKMGRSGDRESDAERQSVVCCENDEWYSVTCRKQKRSPTMSVRSVSSASKRGVLATCKEG